MQGRISDRQDIPRPSSPKCGQKTRDSQRSHLGQTGTLSRHVGHQDQQLRVGATAAGASATSRRLLDLDHDSRLDQIENAARAMGRELHIELRPGRLTLLQHLGQLKNRSFG
jgi:antitoxin HicB